MKNKYLVLIIILVLFIFSYFFTTNIYKNGINNNNKYVEKIFDDTKIHNIDIQISEKNWEDLLNNAIDKKYYLCNVIINNEKFENVGIRTKGNISLKGIANDETTNRYSFKIKFNKYIKNNTYYGLDNLVLNNLIADVTYIKEYITYDMMEQIGAIAPQTAFVNITINGKPWGLYLGIEDIRESFLIRHYGNNYGNLYKASSDLVYINDNENSYNTIFNNTETKITNYDKKNLINSLKILNNEENLEVAIDIENTLKYWVVHNFVDNYDSYTGYMTHNYYLYEKNGLLTMIPWDYNIAFGAYPKERTPQKTIDIETEMVNLSIYEPISYHLKNKRPMWEKIIEKEKYRNLYNEYYITFIKEYFESGYFENKINNTYNLIYPYVKNDKTSFYNIKEFEKGYKTINEFCLLRTESIKKQLIKKDSLETSEYINASHINLNDMVLKEKVKALF